MTTFEIVQPNCGPRGERVVLGVVEAEDSAAALDAFAHLYGFADHADACKRTNVGEVRAEEKQGHRPTSQKEGTP